MLSEVGTGNCVGNPGGHTESNPRPSKAGVSFCLVLRPLGRMCTTQAQCFGTPSLSTHGQNTPAAGADVRYVSVLGMALHSFYNEYQHWLQN